MIKKCEFDETMYIDSGTIYRLPSVHLKSNNIHPDIISAGACGNDPCPWKILVNIYDEESARSAIWVNDVLVADIKVFINGNTTIEEEVQSISAAILWSAIRSWTLNNKDNV